MIPVNLCTIYSIGQLTPTSEDWTASGPVPMPYGSSTDATAPSAATGYGRRPTGRSSSTRCNWLTAHDKRFTLDSDEETQTIVFICFMMAYWSHSSHTAFAQNHLSSLWGRERRTLDASPSLRPTPPWVGEWELLISINLTALLVPSAAHHRALLPSYG